MIRICECGIAVNGTSRKQVAWNMKQHKKSDTHKVQMSYVEKHRYDEIAREKQEEDARDIAEESRRQEEFRN